VALFKKLGLSLKLLRNLSFNNVAKGQYLLFMELKYTFFGRYLALFNIKKFILENNSRCQDPMLKWVNKTLIFKKTSYFKRKETFENK